MISGHPGQRPAGRVALGPAAKGYPLLSRGTGDGVCLPVQAPGRGGGRGGGHLAQADSRCCSDAISSCPPLCDFARAGPALLVGRGDLGCLSVLDSLSSLGRRDCRYARRGGGGGGGEQASVAGGGRELSSGLTKTRRRDTATEGMTSRWRAGVRGREQGGPEALNSSPKQVPAAFPGRTSALSCSPHYCPHTGGSVVVYAACSTQAVDPPPRPDTIQL